MTDLKKEQVKRVVENAVLPDDIDNRVLGPIAQKYGPEVIIDFIKAYDLQYPALKDETRRNFHVPTLKTVTQKAHSRLF